MRARSILAVSWVLSACAHAPRTPAHDRSLLTRDEIVSVSGATTMYDVIRRTRNEYLTNRGRTSLIAQGDPRPVVFLDDQEFGPIESLNNIHPDAVKEVEFYNASAAVSKFGSRYVAGVIQLRSRGG